MPNPKLACAKNRFISSAQAFAELEEKMERAVRLYSNIHRGTGQHSAACTHLYEYARTSVLQFWQLDPGRFHVIFGDRKRLMQIKRGLRTQAECREIYSNELGLALGVGALVVPRHALASGIPPAPGGGTVRLVSPRRILWARAPERFEAGTPNILGVIALAKALTIIRGSGDAGIFKRGRRLLTLNEVLHGQDPLPAPSAPENLRELVMGQEEKVPIRHGNAVYLHLDNSSSTQALKPAWEAWRTALRVEESVETSRTLLARARITCHDFFEAPESDYACLFTTNTTDGVLAAAENFAARYGNRETGSVVVTSWIEHHSNDLPWRFLPGIRLLRLPADAWGQPDLKRLEQWLRAYNHEHCHGRWRIRLVALSGASNVLGLYTEIQRAADLAHAYQAEILVDGAQLSGHRRVRVQAAGLDYYAFSGHKMYAPFGVGGLLVRKKCLDLDPVRWQEIQKSGEENAAGLAALAAAMGILKSVGMEAIESEERRLTAYAVKRLNGLPGITLYGAADPDSHVFGKKAGIVTFSFRTLPHNLAAEKLAELGGIGVRNGCFCAHMLVKKLLRVGSVRDAFDHLWLRLVRAPWPQLAGMVRVSFGLGNRIADVDALCQVLNQALAERISVRQRLMARLRRGSPLSRNCDYASALDAWLEEQRGLIFLENSFSDPTSLCPKKSAGSQETALHIQN